MPARPVFALSGDGAAPDKNAHSAVGKRAARAALRQGRELAGTGSGGAEEGWDCGALWASVSTYTRIEGGVAYVAYVLCAHARVVSAVGVLERCGGLM